MQSRSQSSFYLVLKLIEMKAYRNEQKCNLGARASFYLVLKLIEVNDAGVEIFLFYVNII